MGSIKPSELPELDDGCVVCFDTETSGLHPDDGAFVSAVGVAWREPDGELVRHAWAFAQGMDRSQMGLFDEDADSVNLGQNEWDALLEWLDGKSLVAHNAKFDVLMCALGAPRGWEGRNLRGSLHWDTQLAAWVLDPLERRALKVIAARLWGEQEQEAQKALEPYLGSKNNPRFDLVPWGVLERYLLDDVSMGLRLYEHQQARLDEGEGGLREEIEREIEVTRALCGMEIRGIGFDRDSSREASEVIQSRVNELVLEMPYKATEDGARQWFFVVHKALPHCVTEKGKPSVGECCVRVLREREVVGADLWAEFRKLRSAQSMWYTGYADKCGPDGMLRTSFRHDGTITGRFSSNRVNLQALPHSYRLDVSEHIDFEGK